MKRASKKKRGVLKRQSVRRKRKGMRFAAGLRSIWFVCKGCFKGAVAVLVLALVSFSFLSGYHYLVTSPYLKLENVEVKGVHGKLQDQLLKMANLDSKASLLSLNLRKVKQRLEHHPWVRYVECERQFPHTLVIKVKKQEPRAILLSDGMYFLNRFGEPFKKVEPADDADFPLITGLREKDVARKKRLGRVTRVMEELRNQKSPWSLADLAEIHVEGGDLFTLYFEHMDAGIRVSSESLPREVMELRRVVAHLVRSGKMGAVRAIDLGYGGGAVVSFRKG